MKQVFQLGTFSIIGIGLVFASQWFILTQLGAGIETDAFFAAMTLPQLILAVISSSLTLVLIPLFSGENSQQIRHDTWIFLILIGSLFSFLACLFYISAGWWIPLSLPGFNKVAQELTIKLTHIQLIGMVFTAINAVQWASYHAKQQFLWVAFTPVLTRSTALLLLIWMLPRFGIIAAAWINLFEVGLQTLLLSPTLFPFVPLNLKSSVILVAWSRIKPLLLGTIYYKTDPMIDRFLLSSTHSGNLSLYYLAQQMYGAVSVVINKAIVIPLMPILSNLHKSGNKNDFLRLYYRKMSQIGLITVLGLVIVVTIGQNLLGLLIGYGNISATNVKQLWWIMIWLSGTFIGGMVGQVSSSSFYAVGDTTTPTRFGIISYTFYIPAKFALFHYFGVIGLALASSMFLLVNFFLQNYQLRKKYF